MRKVLSIVCGLAVLAGLFLWASGDGAGEAPRDTERRDRTRDAEPVVLAGRGDEEDAHATAGDAGADAADASGSRPRFVVHVRARPLRSIGAFGGGWDDGKGTRPDEAPSPFAGMEVRLLLRRGSAEVEVGRAKLDARGELVRELPQLAALTALARSATRLHVLPADAGRRIGAIPPFARSNIRYQVGYIDIPARPEGNPTVLRLILPVSNSELVTGRVVDARGDPINDVHVRLVSSDGGTASEDCTGPDGAFAIEVQAPGTFKLWCHALDGRSATRGALTLAPHVSNDLGSVVLEDEEAFAGRVVYPDGAPVSGLAIDASHHYRNMHVSYGPPSVPCQPHARGRSTRTDAEGRYRIHPGIVTENDMWFVRPEFVGNARCESAHTSPEKTRTDMDGVMHGHRVRMRVADPDGSPVYDARVVLRPVRQEDTPRRKAVSAGTRRDGTCDVWLTRGSIWTVEVVTEGGRPVRRGLSVPRDTNESTLDVEVRPLDLRAGIRVGLTDPAGASIYPIVLQVRTEAGTRVWSRRSDDPGFFLALAPGVYDVTARSIERAPWLRARGRWLPVNRRVEVAEGTETVVQAVSHQAAHAEVTLRVAANLDPKSDRMPHIVSVHFEHERTGWKHEALVSGMYTGEATDTPHADFPPGTYLVEVVEPGWKTVTRRVALREGEVTKLEFTLDPE